MGAILRNIYTFLMHSGKRGFESKTKYLAYDGCFEIANLQLHFSSMPWNTKSVKGFFLGSIFCATASGTYVYVNNLFLSFFIGIVVLCKTFRLQFQAIIRNFADITQSGHRNDRKAKQLLCEAINFQNSVKE